MNGVDVFFLVKTEGYASLVGDYDDSQAGLIEPGDGFWDAGKQVEVLPVGDVLALGQLAVDYAVAVEEDGLQGFGLDAHAAMIAIS